MKKMILYLFIALVAIPSIYELREWNRKSKLDDYYLGSLITVKSRLHYGSAVDTKEELEKFEDQLTLYMYLDGYNGVEITEMKCRASIKSSSAGR